MLQSKVSLWQGLPFSARPFIIRRHAKANGVPYRLARAVVQVESNFKEKARGAAGEIGLMQLMPTTARYIGYKGKMRALYKIGRASCRERV